MLPQAANLSPLPVLNPEVPLHCNPLAFHAETPPDNLQIWESNERLHMFLEYPPANMHSSHAYSTYLFYLATWQWRVLAALSFLVTAWFILQQAFKNTEKAGSNFLKQCVDLKKNYWIKLCQCSCLFVVKLITSCQFTCIIILTILICEL